MYRMFENVQIIRRSHELFLHNSYGKLSWHNNEHQCVNVYIYIYIYIYDCICVGISLCSWMSGQREELISGIFEGAPEYLEDLPLSVLARRSHKKLCPRKPTRLEEWTKDIVSQEWDSGEESQSLKNGTPKQSFRSETPKQRVQKSSPGHEAVKTMTRWVSIFDSCVGFSQSSSDSHEHT